MKLFRCQSCQNALHFNNTVCLNCQHAVGYLQDQFEMSALEREDGAWRALAVPGSRYRFCENVEFGVCNWLAPTQGGARFCESCRHNRLVPDLSVDGNLERWQKLELAKRYVFRSLMRWRLPTPDRIEDPEGGLVFDLIGEPLEANGNAAPLLTGHDNGLITLNIAEADDAERERRRTSMGEAYRTLIGHFRHEIGHFYWDRLIRDTDRIEAFRSVFGDEQADYDAALKRHYEFGPPVDWPERFISSYASSHPWEDFAETWAHYTHIVDALETARSYGIDVEAEFDVALRNESLKFEPYAAKDAAQLIRAWVPLTVAINGVNRSMGQPDLYPFVLSNPVMEKLQFVHALIRASGRNQAELSAPRVSVAA
jgi:hypothetical protein